MKKDWCISQNSSEEVRKAVNRYSREEMKVKLLIDIRSDLIICEIEGWDKKEYILELKDLIDGFYKKILKQGRKE